MTTSTDAVPSPAFEAWASEEGINNFHFNHCWDAWQAALASVAPASEVRADHIADERAAFEEWCLTFCGVGVESLEQTVGGAYVSGYVDDMWDGWKARAAREAIEK